MTAGTPWPAAIGGIGGSGTRVLAALLHQLGYFLGDDLNAALDNLWFTLLFKRRSILLEGDAEFRALLDAFLARLSGDGAPLEATRTRVIRLAQAERLQHPRAWLEERVRSFTDRVTARRPGQRWGWKEPNTHVVIDRILAVHPCLRYLHIHRHPLDMAVSRNQNQLQVWGPVFLDRDIGLGPRESLAYWCAAHRRIAAVLRSWPDRTLMVDFDALCAAPEEHGVRIAELLGVPAGREVLSAFRSFVRQSAAPNGPGRVDPAQYDPADLGYVERIGYRIP